MVTALRCPKALARAGRKGSCERMLLSPGSVRGAPDTKLLGLVLLFIEDRPLCSSNGKSYFCTNKSFAPMVVVTGRRSLFGVYGKVFTGEAWMASRLRLLSFCSGGTRAPGGPPVPPPVPPHIPSCSGHCRCPCCCSVCSVPGQGTAWHRPGLFLLPRGGSALCCFPPRHAARSCQAGWS